jgi:ankyrin repeat protein
LFADKKTLVHEKVSLSLGNKMPLEICHFLLLIGADKDAKDGNGNTPFDIAIKA